jgi:REP element-mobilizing transposase RayT
MARRTRIEFPNALYHVTSRGDRQETIFVDDTDRWRLLEIVAEALFKFDARMLAYCLMSNHYHFVMRTRQANLSRVMQHVNGVYTQAFNRRHGKTGHLFQGRYHDHVVDSDRYMLAACRYVESNPVRAGLSGRAAEWKWSSYRAHVGLDPVPDWLASAELLGCVLERDILLASDRHVAIGRYESLVASDVDASAWRRDLRKGRYVGDESFAARVQAQAEHYRRFAAPPPRSLSSDAQ